MENRPISREKHVTDNSKGVARRGTGLGAGSTGGTGSHGSAGSAGNSSGSSGGYGNSGGGRRSPLLVIIALVLALLGGGGALTTSMLGGSSSGEYNTPAQTQSQSAPTLNNNTYTGSSIPGASAGGEIDLTVAEGSRAKYTKLKGDGTDIVTLMVYMCGTDLESRSGMATNDIKEMLNAKLSDKVNLIIYTGGCKQWKNNVISSTTNQIYQIKDNNLICLQDNLGSVPMTTPSTLAGFIEYCHGNFPADRYELILWDHGGGSVSGYGYDEKYASSGSMSLSGIKKALGDANVDFDFIGFDACLMATLENGLMLADYADYMIASEETEPGVGWYYTNWLTALANNTSISTVELGSKIVDDFVNVCAGSARGQKTTLSVVDLAELSNTVPDKLRAFSSSTSDMIKGDKYTSIASARSATREFSPSSKIDQVDLVNLAENIGTTESKELAEALKGAVKYNLTSSNMTNANGISIYFPYRKLSYVDKALSTYNQIGMDDTYSRCIKEYAGLETTGQAVSYNDYGSSYSPLASLFGITGSASTGAAAAGTMDSDMLTQLMGSMFLSGRALSDEASEEYVNSHKFNAELLKWTKDDAGIPVISMPEDQWSLITDVELNMFYDDGTGYIDLGLDNALEFNEAGDLLASTDKTWVAINGQPVSYHHMSSMEVGDGYSITGYVPAFLDGERVNLILEFTSENPYGEIVGASRDYKDTDVEVQAKNLEKLEAGSRLEFLCNYYSYQGEFQDTYYLGEPMEVTDKMEISNVAVGDSNVIITYRFADVYNNSYWTASLKMK